MFPHDCTLYYKTLNKTTRLDEYIRAYVYEVFFDNVEGINITKSGAANENKALIVIPDTSISIRKGDIIVKGIIDYTFVTLADIQKKFTNVYIVTSVDVKDFGGLQHIEVGAK